jgi:general secretion pathway protein G
MQRKAFSLIELIFMIVVMGVIASVALPKLMNTKNNAVVSSLKQDISTVVTSVQSYYLVNGKIDKISDSVTLNSSNWDIADKEIKYLENEKVCVSIKITNNKLEVTIDETTGNICQALSDGGSITTSYDL